MKRDGSKYYIFSYHVVTNIIQTFFSRTIWLDKKKNKKHVCIINRYEWDNMNITSNSRSMERQQQNMNTDGESWTTSAEHTEWWLVQ